MKNMRIKHGGPCAKCGKKLRAGQWASVERERDASPYGERWYLYCAGSCDAVAPVIVSREEGPPRPPPCPPELAKRYCQEIMEAMKK